MSDARTGDPGGIFPPGSAPTRVEALRAARALACTAAFTLACAIYVAVRYVALGGRAERTASKRI